MKNEVPEGYMRNSKGGLDPIELVKEIDIKRNELVMGIVTQAAEASKHLADIKQKFMQDIESFVRVSEKKYGIKKGGAKGNMTFLSYDGKYKVVVAINENVVFDERLQIAKQLIDECIQTWAEGSLPEIKALVQDAFYVGKSGKIDKNRILGLRRLDIKDKKWQKAMQAISDSLQVSGSKQYIRIYQRVDGDRYDLLNLDIAAL